MLPNPLTSDEVDRDLDDTKVTPPLAEDVEDVGDDLLKNRPPNEEAVQRKEINSAQSITTLNYVWISISRGGSSAQTYFYIWVI